MKKMIFVTLALVAMMSISCTEDFTNPEKLNGTTWKCSTFPVAEMSAQVEYYEVKFTSTTAGESWIKPKNVTAYKESTFTYTIKDDKISVVVDKTTTVGTIDKKTMTIPKYKVDLVYTKQ